MKAVACGLLAIAAISLFAAASKTERNDPPSVATSKGLKWLVAVQGKDGGWGQDGGETSYVRTGERLETNGNDVANTSVAALALLHAGNTMSSGEYQDSLRRAVHFLLKNIEQSPEEGLAVTNVTGTQIQRKLGPYIDTFLSSMLFAELDGNMENTQSNQRLRKALQKVVAKIEKNQQGDGSWNIAGGWAPILGTSMASQSLHMAQAKGLKVAPEVAKKVESYTMASTAPQAVVAGSGGGVRTSLSRSEAISVSADAASAGVPLYKDAQILEQLSRTEADRTRNKVQIAAVAARASDARFVNGYGSMGGEEFFSYLNMSNSLRRSGGVAWDKWNNQMKLKLVTLQNEDGTWAGHHCITGRVAVTSAAILTILAERQPVR
jgi:hypothetical protein